jgi:hypothetical protein
MNKCILVISDQHFPYNHPDIISFLSAIKKKYKPDRIVNIGDEFDFNGISYHEKNTELVSANDELNLAKKMIKPISKIFPRMDILMSNHGSLVYRKANTIGLPHQVLRSYREILNAPKGWHWHDELVIKASNGKSIFFCHSRSSNVLKNSQEMGMSFVSGHHHSQFEIRYWGNKLDLFWAMSVGCLIDDKSLAFAYNKMTVKRPVIGCAIILDGHPRLLPMILNKSGRWTKELV